ncbi:MAG: PAS domain S-box protein [Thermodesulfovibrionales bacterium]
MGKRRLIYRLIGMLVAFALMITVPMTFTIFTQVNKLISEEEELNPPETEAYAKVHREFTSKLFEQVIPYVFYILIMALMLSMLFARKMLVSLKELQRGSKAIMDGDLDIKLQVTGDDELGAVIGAFNEMASSLRQKTIDLQKKDIYVNAMLDPLWVVSETNRVTDINPAFTALFGYSRDEIVGASIFDFFDEHNAAIVRGQLKDHRDRGLSSIYEVTIISRDGSSIPVLISGSPIMNAGEVTGKIGIFKDFREQRQLRNELQRSKEYVETVMDSIEDQLLVIDRDFRIVTANKIAFTNSRGPVLGEFCHVAVHDSARPCWAEGHECPAQTVFITGTNFRTIHQHIGPDGEKRFHEIVASPIMDQSGKVQQVIELLRDVTDRVLHDADIYLKNTELVTLNSISRLLSSSLRADEIFATVLDRMIELIKMEGGGLFFIDEKKKDMVCHYHKGISEEYVRMIGRIRLGEDIPGKVAVTGQIMTTSDISTDRRIERSVMKYSGMKGYCCIPVKGKERIIGVFCLFSFKPHTFTAEEESILVSIGEMTGIALENIKLYEKMRELYEHQRQRREQEQAQLLSLTTKLGSATDLRFILGRVIEQIREICNADYSWMLARDGSDNFFLKTSSTPSEGTGRVIFTRGMSTIEGYALEKRAPVIITDIRSETKFFIPPEISGVSYHSALAVPMLVGEKSVGVITLYYLGLREFRDEELHFLRIIANMLAVSLERYDYYIASISEKSLSETILQSVADGIVTVDTGGRIIAVNKAFEQMTGISRAEGVGMSLCDTLKYHAENADLGLILGESLEAALAGSKNNRDAVMMTARSGKISVRISSSPVLGPDNAVTGVAVLMRDISREKEIDAMKTEIIRSVSHGFRTPLSAIVGMTEMILDGDVDETKEKNYLSVILSEGMRLSNMVSDLLSIARIESGMERIRPEQFDMKKFLDELLFSLNAAIDKKQAAVRYDIGGVSVLYADPGKLKQVLMNIIDNSLTFSDPGCRIDIKVNKRDTGIEITIQDTGWGIPEEDMPHLTERFFRGRHGEKMKGSGLGLFLCSEILRLHGGRMDIRSAPGQGTGITVHLPDQEMP